MGKITVYNTHQEDYTYKPNNFLICRTKDGNPLANPFTYNGVKTKLAKLSFKTREEAIDAYKMYFKKMYGLDEGLTKAFDTIYEKYKNGEDIYLQCCCKPLPCHGDFLAEELQRKLIKEKMEERRKNNKSKCHVDSEEDK
ncbi:MAG TPA: DUF4326 domain-containing protein [Tissierellaceae bacterium]|nr:DUF4326 domain-containing protein [Tissierellaceae bacterium]